jgi:CRISPR-associated protein Cas1
MIAQKLIDAASYNMHRNLRYYNERGKDVKQSMDDIIFLRKSIYETDKVESLMGIEGNIKKSYYSAWNIIINQELEFEKRIRNPPDNVINTMISFTNSLVYTRVLSEIYFTQLNPTISYLHQPGERRFSLSLDISEVFKPLLADRLIFSMLNKKQITKDSFTESLNYLHLEKEASQEIVSVFDSKLNTTIKHKELRRQVSYKQLIRLECYKLIKHLIGEKEYNGFKIWW